MKNLLAKWLSRKGPEFEKIRKYLGLSPKEYRKLIVSLSQTVEQQMCAKHFDGINYEHVPSVAMNKYRKSFYRQDQTRFAEYIANVRSGVSKMCAGAIYPYQLWDAFTKAKKEVDIQAIEAQWYSLPNYMEGSTERILPMVDTSGSMGWYGALPARAGWSLALYLAERNQSIFKDAFLTFSTEPKMIYLQGTISQRIRQIGSAPWQGTTNVEAAFRLLLSKAIENKITEDEMPTTILIMSDMQFDPSRVISYNPTAIEMIKAHYQAAGYKIPRIVFWNLRAEAGNVTASAFDENVGLVSGFSPSVLKSILSGEEIKNEEEKAKEEPKKETPYELMMKVIDSERYSAITI